MPELWRFDTSIPDLAEPIQRGQLHGARMKSLGQQQRAEDQQYQVGQIKQFVGTVLPFLPEMEHKEYGQFYDYFKNSGMPANMLPSPLEVAGYNGEEWDMFKEKLVNAGNRLMGSTEEGDDNWRERIAAQKHKYWKEQQGIRQEDEKKMKEIELQNQRALGIVKEDDKAFLAERKDTFKTIPYLRNIDRSLSDLKTSKLIVGPLAEQRLWVARFAVQMGWGNEDLATQVALTEKFLADGAVRVGKIIKQFGSGTGLSDADRIYAELAAAGKITLSRAGLESILNSLKTATLWEFADINRRARDLTSRLGDKAEMTGPLTVDPGADYAEYFNEGKTEVRIAENPVTEIVDKIIDTYDSGGDISQLVAIAKKEFGLAGEALQKTVSGRRDQLKSELEGGGGQTSKKQQIGPKLSKRGNARWHKLTPAQKKEVLEDLDAHPDTNEDFFDAWGFLPEIP